MRSLFVRDNFAAAKAAAALGEPHAAVMRALSEQWHRHKAALSGDASGTPAGQRQDLGHG